MMIITNIMMIIIKDDIDVNEGGLIMIILTSIQRSCPPDHQVHHPRISSKCQSAAAWCNPFEFQILTGCVITMMIMMIIIIIMIMIMIIIMMMVHSPHKN